MTSNPSTSVSLTESLITTGAFSGANWLVWGTKVATWLNCPASPLGMALAGAMQGVTAGLVKTFATHSFGLQNRPWLQTAIAIGGIALGTFAAFLLAKPLAAYVGVITLRAAISSAILCSLIQVVSSYVYSRFVPPQPRLQQLLQNLDKKIDKMKENEFNAFLKDLTDELEKNPPKSWDDLHLPLRVRYAIQSKITQEKRTLPPLPLPTDTISNIQAMKYAEFVELLQELDKKKKPLLWNNLSLDIQYALWTSALWYQKLGHLQEFPQPPSPTSTLEKIKTMTNEKFERLIANISNVLNLNQALAVEFWDNLPLSLRYAIWNRKLQEQITSGTLPPLPTDSPEGIKQMSGGDFQELLNLTTQQDGKEAPFWKELSEEVQNTIWQRRYDMSQSATDMPLPPLSNEQKKFWGISSQNAIILPLPRALPERAFVIIEQSFRKPLFQVTFLKSPTSNPSVNLQDCIQAIEEYEKLKQAIQDIPNKIKGEITLNSEYTDKIDDWVQRCIQTAGNQKSLWNRAQALLSRKEKAARKSASSIIYSFNYTQS